MDRLSAECVQRNLNKRGFIRTDSTLWGEGGLG